MPAFVAGDIGPTYDMGISLRTAADTLACKNRQGVNQNLNKVAFMTSTSGGAKMEEATELQRKQAITQFASSNVVDREFDQWPQVTQGDWSDGMLQRVFSGGQNLPSRYWDGVGVLWPLSDYVPQRAIQKAAITVQQTVDQLQVAATGPAGQTNQWSQVYSDNTTSKYRLLGVSGDTVTDLDITASIPFTSTIQDFFYFDGAYWYVTGTATNGGIYFGAHNTLPTLFQAMPANYNGRYETSCGGYVGSTPYVAVHMRNSSGVQPIHKYRLFNVQNLTGAAPKYLSTAFTDINFGAGDQPWNSCFLGDNFVFTMSAQDVAVQIVAFNVATQTYAKLADIKGYTIAWVAPIAGGLFVLAYNRQAFSIGIAKAELFLLQGQSLQSIGPLQIQLSPGVFAFAQDFTQPNVIGPYAIFGCFASDGTNSWFVLYAYDVLRGRLFKVSQDQLGSTESVSTVGGSKLAVCPNFQRTQVTNQRLVDFNIVRARGDPTTTNAPMAIAQEYLLGIQNSVASPPVRTPFTVTSSLIDFTSSQPKLYREVKVGFDALANDASVTVTLDVWLDKDPGALSVSPDFTTTVAGNTSPGATSLALFVNKMAIKLVYRLTCAGATVDSAGSLVNAAKPQWVATRIATGWVWNATFDMARNVMKNQGSGYCFEAQDTDEVAAYNFLRNVWRLRGGECVLTLPNGDSYNALIQMERMSSPKPLGVSDRADIPQDRYENQLAITIREDV